MDGDTAIASEHSLYITTFQEARQPYRGHKTVHLSLQPDESGGVERALHGYHYRSMWGDPGNLYAPRGPFHDKEDIVRH